MSDDSPRSADGLHDWRDGGRTRAVDVAAPSASATWDWLDAALTVARANADTAHGDTFAVDDVLDARLESSGTAAAWQQHEPLGARGEALLISALRATQSELTQRDVALVLSWAGAPDSLQIADALGDAYRASQVDPGRRPGLLRAMAIFAERSPVARHDLFGALQRISASDSPYLRVAASKVIGRFEGLGLDTTLRSRLHEWTEDEEAVVRGEALMQSGLLALREALAAASTEALRARLAAVREYMARAEDCEELRVDATRLHGAVALVHACLPPRETTAVDWAGIDARAAVLLERLTMAEQPWVGYASHAERVLDHRYFQLAEGVRGLARCLASHATWTNFDATLIELAAVAQLHWGIATVDSVDAGDGPAAWMREVSLRVVRPAVGSVLARAISTERLRQVLDNARARGDIGSEVLASLERLIAAGADSVLHERAGSEAAGVVIGVDDVRQLARDAPAIALQLAVTMPALQGLFEQLGLPGLAALGSDVRPDARPLVATDAVDLFGDDPDVDRTCTHLFAEAMPRVQELLLPPGPWYFQQAVTMVVKIARNFRDDVPTWARAEASGGAGQHVVEAQLRDYLFERLRYAYHSRSVEVEATGVSGGRVDVRLRFGQHQVPIEVKREFDDVSRAHVRASYLAQADRYAAARDGVAFLAILDLREERLDAPYAMPQLSQTFWVDQLPPDPQIAGARPSVIVVGLFRGNRHLPSALSARSAQLRRRSR